MNQPVTVSSIAYSRPAAPADLRPLSFGQSLLLFAVPAVLVALAFAVFRPWLMTFGYDPALSLFGALTVPLALLFAAALVAYNKIEGRPLTWAAFSERMRFPRLRPRDVLFSLAIYAACMLGYGIFSRLGLALIDALGIALPQNLPVLIDPRAAVSLDALNSFAGCFIRGRWDILVLYVVMFFFNIAGEELWWRGYILPRQELAMDRWTWLVHGLLWASFHIYKWWDIPGLLPVCLVIAYAAQRLKTNWPGFIAHAIFNGAPILLFLAAVAGWL